MGKGENILGRIYLKKKQKHASEYYVKGEKMLKTNTRNNNQSTKLHAIAHWAHDVILEIFDLDSIFKACAAPLKSDIMSMGYKMPSQFLLPFHNIKGE